MKKLLSIGLLLAALVCTMALAADDFTPLEVKAWRNTCAETINGDAPLCSCVQTLQVRDHGVKTVKIFYLSMAMMEPELTDDELTEASDGLDRLTGDNDSKIETAIDDFSSTLMDNAAKCGG